MNTGERRDPAIDVVEPAGAGKTVLVVDDEAALAELMAVQLEEEGYQVLVADDGRMALQMMRNGAADVVVTDFMMPKMSGLELARAIRAQERFAGIPIILVSGVNGAVGRRHPELFDAVLDRPHPPGRLIEQVGAVLG